MNSTQGVSSSSAGGGPGRGGGRGGVGCGRSTGRCDCWVKLPNFREVRVDSPLSLPPPVTVLHAQPLSALAAQPLAPSRAALSPPGRHEWAPLSLGAPAGLCNHCCTSTFFFVVFCVTKNQGRTHIQNYRKAPQHSTLALLLPAPRDPQS